MQFAESVVFWKWITGTKLGLVTAAAVYHWDMEVGAAVVGACRPAPVSKGSESRLRACKPASKQGCRLSGLRTMGALKSMN